MTGNDSDAQDATQEALLAIVKGLPRFDGRAKFTTWAYRVATNACLDELRRRRRRPDPVEEIFEAPDPGGPPGVAELVSERLTLDAALDGLSGEYRTAVVLRDVLGLDYAEISEVLDIAPGTVRSRIARGRAGLARSLTAGNQDIPSGGNQDSPSGGNQAPHPNVSTEVPR